VSQGSNAASAFTGVSARKSGPPGGEDIVCFSHLRWNFVFQRPQHLLTRFARTRRVFFFEEPVHDGGPLRLEVTRDPSGVVIAVPHVDPGRDGVALDADLRHLLGQLLDAESIGRFIAWYYTPMARGFSAHLSPCAVVYDCMDELSAFAGAPAGLRASERELLEVADLVLTGGESLFEAKRALHPNVHACPSSVDVAHFARARTGLRAPGDPASIPCPRIGYFGVIDERIDTDLLAGVAALRPEWQLVMVGPVVKIDPASLPRPENIHYLGAKPYSELPRYISGWSAALLPFARNAATRFISPTKTPEYLAAGRPVVSTSIRDVVRPYGELGLARIADTAGDFVAAIEASLVDPESPRLAAADAFLANTSWDTTWARIARLVDTAVAGRSRASARQSRPGGTVTGEGATANRATPGRML
jgi:UDP-galactopyranose mutase